MQKPHDGLPLYDEAAPLEQRVMSAFFRFMHTPWHMVPAPGLTRTETGVLIGIERSQVHGNPLRVRDLSRMMHVSSPTATQHLNKLEEKGFVQRVQSKDDRREVHIEITDKGREELEAQREMMEQNIRELIDHIGEAEAATLESLLRKTSEFFFEKDKTYRE